MIGLHPGFVATYDADVGLGTIDDGAGQSIPFHCTAIAGGSRQIAVGTAVTFVIGAGGPGRWEAHQVTPTD
ncbi:MAG: cold shock domain-containing protein [Actinomycetota bacterium]